MRPAHVRSCSSARCGTEVGEEAGSDSVEHAEGRDSMTDGSHRARLGARLPRLRRRERAQVFAVLIAGLLLLGPNASLAQDTSPPTGEPDGSVRVRAVDDAAADD